MSEMSFCIRNESNPVAVVLHKVTGTFFQSELKSERKGCYCVVNFFTVKNTLFNQAHFVGIIFARVHQLSRICQQFFSFYVSRLKKNRT